MRSERLGLRLPLKSEYFGVLRAAVGAIGGTLSFPYDEIMQLRIAVSEVLTLMMKHRTFADDLPREAGPAEYRLVVRFALEPDRIEILMTCPADYVRRLDSEEQRESEAVLGSLMDEVEYGVEGDGEMIVRMVKRKMTA